MERGCVHLTGATSRTQGRAKSSLIRRLLEHAVSGLTWALNLIRPRAKDTGQQEKLRATQAALDASEARASAILRTAVDGIITIDERGIINSANPAAEKLFGYPADEMIGRNVSMLMPNPYHDAHDSYIANYVRTGQRKIIGIGREVVGLRKNGTVFPMHLAVSEMWAHGRRMFTGIVHDLTEHKKVEDELRQAMEAAEQAHAEAETANQLKDEFLATLSHELRTPLNAMLGWTRLLRLGGMDQKSIQEAIEALERSALAQAQLIEDLLDVSRITSGKLRLEPKAVNLADVVAGAMSSVQPAAEVRQIRIQQNLDRQAGPIWADPGRLQQVVWNLLTNAIKFTPRGGQVTVSTRPVDSQVELIVSDTGKGIAPDFLPHVFERFRQADTGSTRTHSGLGLGLAIVRHIIEMHGGTVEAQSEGLGKGSTFIVRLPIRSAPEPV